jgi:hypothetical protein
MIMKKSMLFLPAAGLLVVIAFVSHSYQSQPATSIKTQVKENSREEGKTEAINALQFFSQMAAFPGKDIPDGAYMRAYEKYKIMLNGNRAMQSSSPSPWQSIGPDNIGGRTISIAIDPLDTSVIWLGSAGGGLWKSSSGGVGTNPWTYVQTGFPVLGVGAIAVDPANHNTIYIGTGETYSYGSTNLGLVDRTTRGTFGIGILKSTDGGNTWGQVLNWSYNSKRAVWDIVFNPLNSAVVYAATTEGIYKSNDAGATWNQVLNITMAMDLEVDKDDTSYVYCGVGNLSSLGKGLYRTQNSGATWNVLTNGLPPANNTGRISVSAYPGGRDTLMASVCNMFNTIGYYISYDKGNTWTMASSYDAASYQGWYSKGILFNAINPNILLLGGIDVYKTTDRGTTVTTASSFTGNGPQNVHSDIHDIVANPKDPNKVYIICDGGLFRSNDFGQSFYDCNTGYVSSQIYIGSNSYQDSTIALAGFQDNFTNSYHASVNWNSVIGGDGSYNAIDPTNDQLQYGSYQYMNLYLSTDQGVSFLPILSSAANASSPSPAAFLAPMVLAPSNTSIIYTGGDSLVVSPDNGYTWHVTGPVPLNGGMKILAIGVSYTNPDTIYVGTAPDTTHPAKIFRSGDGGNTYTDISVGLPNRYVRSITVSPKNSLELYATFSGFGTGHIFHSLDAGTTWTDISTTLPDMPMHCLAIDPWNTSYLYAGTDFGVLLSMDRGVTWNPFVTGLPEAVMVYDLKISPANRSLYAFTHGHGAFTRQLQPLPLGINEHTLARMRVYPNPASHYLSFQLNSGNNALASIRIFSLDGKQVYDQQRICSQGKTEIDVSAFSSGTYLVAFEAEGKTSSGRFVVVH